VFKMCGGNSGLTFSSYQPAALDAVSKKTASSTPAFFKKVFDSSESSIQITCRA
jgi:hypothetical protein